MKKTLGAIVAVAAVVATGAGPVALAGNVNCKLVMKNLAVGRTPAQIAETMVISEGDVKKCMEAEKSKAGEKGEAAESAGGEQGHGQHKGD